MKRVVFLDYLRVIAIFMVMIVHACEQYYFGPDGGFRIESLGDARWVVGIDSAVRACVPLFVMASAYLLFPIGQLKVAQSGVGSWLGHRFLKVGIPFAIWCCVYTWWNGGEFKAMLFNFPMATGGHLWFVPMLFGIYLLMPLLSPWAEKVTKRELGGWLILWFVTTTFPFLRKLCAAWCGAPDYGVMSPLYGECPWNAFGTFHYLSGFVGYMLLGFWFRKFGPSLSWRRTLAVALPLWLVGWAIVAGGFYFRIPNYGVSYPVSAPYAAAVDLEMSWEFCSTGVAMTVIAYFLLIRRLTAEGMFYRWVIKPLAAASYGVYLMHIIILVALAGWLKPNLPTPMAIASIAILTYLGASLLSMILRRIPLLGRLICG